MKPASTESGDPGQSQVTLEKQRMEAQRSEDRAKTRVAVVSVGAAIVLTTLKLLVGLLTGSLGLLSEAAHSGLDLLASVLTLFSVRIASRPADADHP